MKTIYNLFIIILISLFSFSSCGDIIDPLTGGGTGTLIVNVSWSDGSAPSEVQSLAFTISGDGINTKTQTFEPTKSQIEISNLATGNKTVTVEGKNSNGDTLYRGTQSTSISKNANTAITVTLTRTSSPTGVKAEAGNGQVTISWDAVSGATSYNIYWSRLSKYNYDENKTNVTSPYTHTDAYNCTTYYYIVTAITSFGESDASSEVSATPGSVTLSAPTGVSASAGDSVTTIVWDAVSGAESYNIYMKTSSDISKTNYTDKKTSITTTSYTWTGLTNGTTHYFVVTAVNACDEDSAESSQVSAAPKAGSTGPLTSDATDVTDTSVTLNGSFYNPTGYTTTVYFEYGTTTSYGNTTTATAYAQTGDIIVSYNPTGLIQSTTYHYRLVTQNSGGTSYGNDKAFTTYKTPTILASGFSHPIGIAVDSTNVYWTDTYSDTVNKVSINGGTVTTLASGFGDPIGIVVDSANVYWTEYDGGTVKKVSINGGTPITLASGLNEPFGITVDSTNVYWTENGSGTVKKVGK